MQICKGSLVEKLKACLSFLHFIAYSFCYILLAALVLKILLAMQTLMTQEQLNIFYSPSMVEKT